MDYNKEYQRWTDCKDLDPSLKAELLSMNEKEKEAHGVNTSLVHVDFMVGAKDLDIVGETESKEKFQVFKNGNWAF